MSKSVLCRGILAGACLLLLALYIFPDVFAGGSARAQNTAQGNDGVIGTIMDVEGSATITGASGAPAAAAVDTPVHMHDVIETGKDSKAFVHLIDDTELTLAGDSRLTIDEYVFDPDDNTNNKGRYSVMRGAFTYVSGLVAKKPDPDVQIATPYGSIGVRGTKLWAGDVDGEYGIHVDEGQVNVQNGGGQVLVNSGMGTSLHNRMLAPSRPNAWSADRLNRAHAKTFLKNRALIRQRIAARRGRQMELRQRFKRFMQARPMQSSPAQSRPGTPRDMRREMNQERRQNMHQNMQMERRQDRSGLRRERQRRD